MNHKNLTRVLAAAVILLAAGSLHALVMPMTGAELTMRSDIIVSGVITGTFSSWNDAHTLIFTDITVKVDKVEKGNADNTITVRIPGGEVGDVGLAVEDVPLFATGQKVTLSLIRSTDAGVFELMGGYQGAIIDGRAPAYYSYTGYHRSPASISYYINSSLPSGWSTAIQAGGTAWNGAGAAFTFNYAGTTTRVGPTGDGYNIVWRTDLGAGGTIAANYYWYDRRTKIISENDIIFNSRLPWSASGNAVPGYFDVQNIATHELGHCLCLNDIYKSYQSEMTMYGYGATGEIKKQTLASGDIDGIRFIYGQGQDDMRNNTRAVTD